VLPPFPPSMGEPATCRGDDYVMIVLAGNTPLVGWPAMLAALWAGYRVQVKCSHQDRYWPMVFAESVGEVDKSHTLDMRSRITFHDDREEVPALFARSHAIICYGSDQTLQSLRAMAPADIPFYGFGHAISLIYAHFADNLLAIAKDTLMYAQSGCLSPQYLFVEGGDAEALSIAKELASPDIFPLQCQQLDVPSVTDAGIARRVQEARALALFAGQVVYGDEHLRWTIIVTSESDPQPDPVGHCTLFVVATQNGDFWHKLPPERQAQISCIGTVGALPFPPPPTVRVCSVGEMQTPPLDWKNGGVDLFSLLLRLGK
jgi:hypothetical protein